MKTNVIEQYERVEKGKKKKTREAEQGQKAVSKKGRALCGLL